MEIKVKKSQVKEIEDTIKAEVNKSMPAGVRKSVMDTEVEVTKGEYLSISKYFKGIAFKDWGGAERELTLYKAMGESIGTEGGNLVPTQFSNELIEMLKERAVVRSMPGVQVIPMTRDRLEYARQDSATSVTWVGENVQIAESTAPSFGSVVLQPKKMAALVPVSYELLADAGINVDALLRRDFVEQMALKEDLAFLEGTGGTQPLGIYNTPGVNNTTLSGATFKFDNVLDADLEIRKKNGMLTGWIGSPVLAHQLRTLKDTSGRFIYTPDVTRVTDASNAEVGNLYGAPFMISNTVSVTKGATANQTYAIAGQWSNFLIGEREGIRIDVSSQAGDYFAKDEIVFRAIRRVDCALRHPDTFSVVKGIATA